MLILTRNSAPYLKWEHRLNFWSAEVNFMSPKWSMSDQHNRNCCASKHPQTLGNYFLSQNSALLLAFVNTSLFYVTLSFGVITCESFSEFRPRDFENRSKAVWLGLVYRQPNEWLNRNGGWLTVCVDGGVCFFLVSECTTWYVMCSRVFVYIFPCLFSYGTSEMHVI